MKHTLFTRCLSLILAMALSVQMVPAQAFAAKNDAADSSWEVPLQPTESPITAAPQEIAEKRTAYSKTFSMENGLQQHTVYSDAVHYGGAYGSSGYGNGSAREIIG